MRPNMQCTGVAYMSFWTKEKRGRGPEISKGEKKVIHRYLSEKSRIHTVNKFLLGNPETVGLMGVI